MILYIQSTTKRPSLWTNCGLMFERKKLLLQLQKVDMVSPADDEIPVEEEGKEEEMVHQRAHNVVG